MKMTEIVLKAKIFKLHQQQNNSIDESEDLQQNLLSLDIYGQSIFSLDNFQQMQPLDLEGRVFTFNDEVQEDMRAYYQIKLKKFWANKNEFIVLQIHEISAQIKFDKLADEQRILQQVNACFSHEMKNPINSILSQNLKLKEIAHILLETIDNKEFHKVSLLKKVVVYYCAEIKESSES